MQTGTQSEQPGAAWRLMDARSTAAIVVPLFALGLVGWYLTVRQAMEMTGMITGLGQIGTHMASDMAWPAFMVMWLAMMAAMMLPAIGPVLLVQRTLVRQRADGLVVSVGFVAGYLGVWLLVGLVPLLTFLAFRNVPMEVQSSPWLQVVGGAVLVVAGIYQFTPWKGICLHTCRSPLAFAIKYKAVEVPGALHAGVSYGAYCVGSCWALMAILLAVGLMNLVWMGAIAVVFFAEKNWRHGVFLARAVGAAVTALGVAVAAVPSLLSAISS
jgi:predicted metal-binding membrane protein